MAIPSFDELLSQARQIAQSQESERTGTLLSKGLSEGFTNAFLTPPTGTKQYEGYLTKKGDVVQQPYKTGESLVERGFGKLFGKEQFQPPAGALGITGEQGAELQMKRILQREKPQVSLEKTLGETHSDLTDKQLQDIYGERATRGMTFRQLQASKPQAQQRQYLSTQNALQSGFSTNESLAREFPELSVEERNRIPVSEVQSRRANKRAEVIAGLRQSTAEEAKDLANADVIQIQIDKIKELSELTNYKGIGPVASIVGKAGQYSPVKELETDADTVELYQQINDVMNQMIYLRSGKQINEEEFKRLKDAFPSPSLNITAFKRRLSTFENVFSEVMSARERRISERQTGLGKKRSPLQGKQKSAEEIFNEEMGQ